MIEGIHTLRTRYTSGILFVVFLITGCSIVLEIRANELVVPSVPCDSACSLQADGGVRPQDQVFLISSRSLGYEGCCADMSRLTCSTFDLAEGACHRQWRSVPLDAFYAADHADVPTIVYVHGNRVSTGEDQELGLLVYRALMKRSQSDAPIRFLIFSWPTTEERPPLKDFQCKAILSDLTAYHLAWIIDRIAPDVRISLIGYSYGARVVGGALHMLGGGTLCGCGLGERVHAVRTPMRVVYLGAADHNDRMLPGHAHDMALSQVEYMLLTINPCDPAMQYYHFSTHRSQRNRHCRPRALGAYGVANIAWLGEAVERIEQIDVCHEMGRDHVLPSYLAVDPFMFRAWQVVSFQDLADVASY